MTASISTSIIACLKGFNEFIAEIKSISSQKNKPLGLDPVPWEDELGRLRMWAANIGAHQTGQSSLDFRLRESSHITEQILKLLEDLHNRLKDSRDVLLEDEEVDNSDDVASEVSDDEETTEIQELRESVATIINCLFQMSMLVRKPAKHDLIMGTRRAEVAMFEPFDYNHVRDKYPKADSLVVERLGLAVTRRRKYLKYRERHALKLKQGIDKIIPDVGDIQGSRNNQPVAEGTVSLLSDTIATDIKVANIRFDDEASASGASQTSYAATLLGRGHITIPRPPKGVQDGSPFECPYCHFIITTKSAGSWNRHVFHDLQPYICIAQDCPTPEKLYSTRHEWLHHSKSAHPTDSVAEVDNEEAAPSVICSLCKDWIKNRRLYDRHVARHLQELALFILPRPDDESDDDDEGRDHSDIESNPESVLSEESNESENHLTLAELERKLKELKVLVAESNTEASYEINDHFSALIARLVKQLQSFNCSEPEEENKREEGRISARKVTRRKRLLISAKLLLWELNDSRPSEVNDFALGLFSNDSSGKSLTTLQCHVCGHESSLVVDTKSGIAGKRLNCPKCPGERSTEVIVIGTQVDPRHSRLDQTQEDDEQTSNYVNSAGSRQSLTDSSASYADNIPLRFRTVRRVVRRDCDISLLPLEDGEPGGVAHITKGETVTVLKDTEQNSPPNSQWLCTLRDGREAMLSQNVFESEKVKGTNWDDFGVSPTLAQFDSSEDLRQHGSQPIGEPVKDDAHVSSVFRSDDELDKEGYQVLHELDQAVYEEQIDTVRSMLNQEALSHHAAGVSKVLSLAVARNNVNMTKLFLSDANRTSEFIRLGSLDRCLKNIAVRKGYLEMSRLLLGKGANPKFVAGPHETTPLHDAAEEGHPELVQLLLKFGADPSIPDSQHRTALVLAELKRNLQVAEILKAPTDDRALRQEEDYYRQQQQQQYTDSVRRAPEEEQLRETIEQQEIILRRREIERRVLEREREIQEHLSLRAREEVQAGMGVGGGVDDGGRGKGALSALSTSPTDPTHPLSHSRAISASYPQKPIFQEKEITKYEKGENENVPDTSSSAAANDQRRSSKDLDTLVSELETLHHRRRSSHAHDSHFTDDDDWEGNHPEYRRRGHSHSRSRDSRTPSPLRDSEEVERLKERLRKLGLETTKIDKAAQERWEEDQIVETVRGPGQAGRGNTSHHHIERYGHGDHASLFDSDSPFPNAKRKEKKKKEEEGVKKRALALGRDAEQEKGGGREGR